MRNFNVMSGKFNVHTESVLRYLVTNKKLNKTITMVMKKIIIRNLGSRQDLKFTRELVLLSKRPISDELKRKH